RQQLGLARACRQTVVERPHAGGRHLPALAAHIDLAGRIVANEDDRDPRHETGAGEAGHLDPDPRAQARRDRLAGDDAPPHAGSVTTILASAAASAGPAPAILIRLIRADAPATRLTSRTATLSDFASSRTSAAFASPSLAAARTRTLSTVPPSAICSIASIA